MVRSRSPTKIRSVGRLNWWADERVQGDPANNVVNQRCMVEVDENAQISVLRGEIGKKCYSHSAKPLYFARDFLPQTPHIMGLDSQSLIEIGVATFDFVHKDGSYSMTEEVR